MTIEDEENNMRLIFRPATQQYIRIQKILEQGRYKTLSELLRHTLNIGLDQIEDEMHERKNNKS